MKQLIATLAVATIASLTTQTAQANTELLKGDFICAVNSKQTPQSNDYDKLVSLVSLDKNETVLLVVDKGDNVIFTTKLGTAADMRNIRKYDRVVSISSQNDNFALSFGYAYPTASAFETKMTNISITSGKVKNAVLMSQKLSIACTGK